MTSDTQREYWDELADTYQDVTTISVADLHYGPLLPGERTLQILPHIEGQRCLELGCGAAQNSICLAKQGALCTGMDISSRQLDRARGLAEEHNTGLTLMEGSLDDDASWPDGPFDLVHSVFALPFVAHPDRVIKRAGDRLAAGGTLVIATAHPVFAGEWLEVEGEGMGLFTPSYFAPPTDYRRVGDEGQTICSRTYPVATIANWIHEAGLRDLQLWEPMAVPREKLHEAPYRSPDWDALHPVLSAIPVAVIYKAIKPAT